MVKFGPLRRDPWIVIVHQKADSWMQLDRFSGYKKD